MDSINRLAKYFHKNNVPYDALYIRYLPLVTSLYIVSISSVYRKDSISIKKLNEYDLFNSNRYPKSIPITESLFYLRYTHNLFNALHPNYPDRKYCDGVGAYMKQFLTSMLSNYDEIRDPESLFYQGEFILSLMPSISASESRETRGDISSGIYMFHHESQTIIEQFIIQNKKFFEEIFGDDLEDIAKSFDDNAHKIGNNLPGCLKVGFCGNFTKTLSSNGKNTKTKN